MARPVLTQTAIGVILLALFCLGLYVPVEHGLSQKAVEIARHVARAKLDVDACVRHVDGMPQMELPWDERRRNVRGAFRCRRPLTGATVAVVDDVMTTGATLDELAHTLKRAGAARVVNWVIARTLPPT